MRTFYFLLLLLGIQSLILSANPTNKLVFVGEAGVESDDDELSEAFKQLRDGGTIILKGIVRLGKNFSEPKHPSPITITSIHEGKDYRRENNARLILGNTYEVNGPMNFSGLAFVQRNKSSRIYCNSHKTVFGKEISCVAVKDGRLPCIVGANSNGDEPNGSNITIDSGQWDIVIGGTFQEADPTTGALQVTINGGLYNGVVCAAGAGRHKGHALLTINNGTFLGGISVLGNDEDESFSGNATITINNGVFKHAIEAARHDQADFKGHYTLIINGGDFTSVVSVTGTKELPGNAASELKATPGLLDKRNVGMLTFTNPLIRGADPWVFFHDGFYYCTSTGGSMLSVRKAANIPDLPYAKTTIVYKPRPGRPYSRNLWSPKIYHFSESEVGKENAGWYLYLSANDGSGRPSQGQRMFVLRSSSGTPLGPYGEVDGARKPHVATKAQAANKDSAFNKSWCGGAKILKHKGKLYAIWVSEVGDEHSQNVGDRYQIICIDRLVNPWTIEGNPVIINRPTLAWEKHGAGLGKRGMYPEVVEGGTPIHSNDGTLYLLYAGSGYWTPYYAIGVMKLTGDDPMNPTHWKKAVRPIFKASDEVVGPGNACYVSSPTGKSRWAIYHAYIGKKIRGVPRRLFAEPYLATSRGVIIGRGSPLPLGTPLKIEVNPMPLRKKISGFTSGL